MIRKYVTAAVLLGCLSVGSAGAQSSGPGSQPAEFPPASFNGKQYVDSNGCVFIRAGIDGNVSWIPRVSRNRKGVCGFKPTLAGQTAATEAPAPAAEPAQAPVAITNAAPATPAPAAAAPVQVARVAPKPKPKPRVVRQVAPKPVRRAAPVARAPAPQPRVLPRANVLGTTEPACLNASALSRQYINKGSANRPVRCGPQAQVVVRRSGLFGTGRVAQAAPAPVVLDPSTRIVPKHVFINRRNTTDVTVPKGYKRVWKDDRLNPRRAEGTIAGYQNMKLVWTSTVPRRLINQANGRDMTAKLALVYPYTDFAVQQRDLGQVTFVRRDGKLAKRILRNPGARRAVQQQPVRTPVYSTRSSPKQVVRQTQPRAQVKRTAPAPKALQGRYVQIGTYGDSANAQRTAQNVQRLGLPVRIGRFDRNGQTLRVVIAGPFGSDAALSGALGRVRGAGYRDAYARK